MEGIENIKPVIKKLSFNHKGKFELFLEDGRSVIVPTSLFPSIKHLSEKKRKKWYIIDDQMFSFDDCNEIFHLEQVLGKNQDYAYKFQ